MSFIIIAIIIAIVCFCCRKAIVQGFKDGWNGDIKSSEAKQNGSVEEEIKKGNKLAAIKKVREETGMSLADAKNFVENLEESLLHGEDDNELSSIDDVDFMDGHDFEYFCADLLRKNGFTNVEVTKGSGDQGVDILATKDGIRYAIQCKNYASPLGNTPVQEVEAGRQFYKCHVGVVLTNSTFTPGAVALAEATRVLLWDRRTLQELMKVE